MRLASVDVNVFLFVNRDELELSNTGNESKSKARLFSHM